MPDSERQRRHVILALVAAVSVAAFFGLLGLSPERWADGSGLKADDLRWRLSLSLAYTALAFLAGTLIIGPLHVLRHPTRPANHMLRRDVGWWAGGLSLGHMLVGSLVHIEGWQVWQLFFHAWPGPGNWFPFHWTVFGLANTVGLLQACLLALLLTISNNRAMRRLGVGRWKWLQRLSYAAFGLIGVHGLAYQYIEGRLWLARWSVRALLAAVIAIQIFGLISVLRRRFTTASSRPASTIGSTTS
jgi:DMSO/TMAO reductase YedYZ heme-binding membrane subunit